MAFYLPLDLEHWIINVFAGSTSMFMVISFIVITSLAAMFRMANGVLGAMFALFVIIFSIYSGEWLFITVILTGLFIGWIIAGAMKR